MSRQPKDSDADHANESVYAPQWGGVVCVNPEPRARGVRAATSPTSGRPCEGTVPNRSRDRQTERQDSNDQTAAEGQIGPATRQ